MLGKSLLRIGGKGMYWYYVITIAIIGIDQLSKWMVVKNMEIYDQITVIENFFYLTSHRNTGAAWGILEGKMNFFYIITVIVVIGVIFYLHKYGKENKLLAVSLSFVLGGVIGHFIGRIPHKESLDRLAIDEAHVCTTS